MGVQITDGGVFRSLASVQKTYDQAEKSGLRAAANHLKKFLRSSVRSAGMNVTSRGAHGITYSDRLIDAVSGGKPKNHEVYVGIMGNRKSTSQTYKLRFFESSKQRVAKKGLKTPRRLGSLARFNGFVERGISAGNGWPKVMEERMDKYIQEKWNV